MMRNKKANEDEKHRKDMQDNDHESYWWLLATLLMAVMMGLAMVSCETETLQAPTEEGLPATIRLNVLPDAITQAQTRADENAIKDLHVLVYNSKGELAGHSYSASSTLTVNTRSGSGYTLYAIANTGNAALFNGTMAATETKLKAMKTAALTSWEGLTTASHLVMAGIKTGVTINAGSSTLQGGISVARIAAKVTLKIGIKSGSGITIKDYQVCSLPTQSLYVAGIADGATGWMDGTKTTVDGALVTKSFFMYENRKGIVSSITVQKDKGEGKAPANATYLIINGETSDYKATWRVYLGENNTSNFNIKRNSQYTFNITLSRPGTDGADTRVEVEETLSTIVGGNSNCYMVKPGNTVTIPVERANESFIELEGSTYSPASGTYHQLYPKNTWTASLVWESSKGLIALSETTGIGPTGSFNVIATNASTEGNAVVAIKSGGNILWSWHIWVTTYDGSTRFINNSGNRIFTFMDRALGASTSSSAGQLTSCGLMYQWGRKDPFPGIGQQGGSWSIINDTDPVSVYNAEGNLNGVTKATVPNMTSNNLTNATRNPNTFYYNTNIPYDWFVYNSSFAQNDDLWSGAVISATTAMKKSVFDPCPAGWRVPSGIAGVSPFAGMTINNGTLGSYGRTWPGTGGYFPASGIRHGNNGNIYYTSMNGCNWLGTPTGTNVYSFDFHSGGVNPANIYSRSHGFPVRCCLDNL